MCERKAEQNAVYLDLLVKQGPKCGNFHSAEKSHQSFKGEDEQEVWQAFEVKGITVQHVCVHAYLVIWVDV